MNSIRDLFHGIFNCKRSEDGLCRGVQSISGRVVGSIMMRCAWQYAKILPLVDMSDWLRGGFWVDMQIQPMDFAN